MSSIFSRIILGEIPSYTIFEDEKVYAFLDIRPLKPGHTLVIPKVEVDNIFDLDKDLYTHLFLVARKIALAIKSALPCTKVGLSVIGLEVPHAHIHLVPIDEISDMAFGKISAQLEAAEFEMIADKIQKALL